MSFKHYIPENNPHDAQFQFVYFKPNTIHIEVPMTVPITENAILNRIHDSFSGVAILSIIHIIYKNMCRLCVFDQLSCNKVWTPLFCVHPI